MNIRLEKEQREYEFLSEYAQKSADSKGRERPEEPCEIRTCYERDRDRILHSKSFRRLKHKTQVFISPEGDHYRTRLTHTLEVAQIARTIATALRLNEYLTEAIALGHDLGHTPFGHSGEDVLNEICPFPFEHNRQSLRVVEELEGGKGLNLTWEVRDGICNHCSGFHPSTLEGEVVYLSDKIAYINHDIDDAIRAKILTLDELPDDSIAILGQTHSKRINTMIVDIIKNSIGRDKIIRSKEIEDATLKLRAYLFEHIYIDSLAKEEENKAKDMLRRLYDYFVAHKDAMPPEFVERALRESTERSVCDYIAGMTDNYAVKKYKELFIPASWQI